MVVIGIQDAPKRPLFSTADVIEAPHAFRDIFVPCSFDPATFTAHDAMYRLTVDRNAQCAGLELMPHAWRMQDMHRCLSRQVIFQ